MPRGERNALSSSLYSPEFLPHRHLMSDSFETGEPHDLASAHAVRPVLDEYTFVGPRLPDVSPPPPPPLPSAGPVLGAERIDSMDVLRGVAVLGILVMNIQSFSMPDLAYNNPTIYGDLEGLNYSVWYWSHILAEFKFITIFSMLFGAGMLVMRDRRIAAGRFAAALHYRRMFFLLVIGCLHGYLLWFGDILYAYAVLGMMLYVLFWAPPWWNIGLGLLAVFFGYLCMMAIGTYDPWVNSLRFTLPESLEPPSLTIYEEIRTYRGSYAEQMEHRPSEMLRIHSSFFPYIASRVGGTILLGMGLYRLQFFNAKLPWWIYLSICGLGGAIGIQMAMEGVAYSEARGWAWPEAYTQGKAYNYWGSIPMSLAWVSLVMMVCKTGFLRVVTRPVAAVGRMAFSNYLMQTVICTTIFYGHGFGLFGKVERLQQIEIVFAIWAFQLILSPAWLYFFRFGPAEWLWRTLSYMKIQPLLAKRERKPAIADSELPELTTTHRTPDEL
jgi:uncharacterized protein